MRIEQSGIAGVFAAAPKVFGDARGYFWESFSDPLRAALPPGTEFVQDNHSRSTGPVLRGLHHRRKAPEAQLVTLLRGEVVDVVVDLRPRSATYRQWRQFHLTEGGLRQVFMPPGCAHGFLVLSGEADLHYKVTQRYDPTDAFGIRWDDPEIGVAWPIPAGVTPILSDKDRAWPRLADADPMPDL